jgi:hypothetical protein
MAMNTWRQYGGIYSNEKYQNIGVGTIVADKLLLRQKSINQTNVTGKLVVSENIDASGQITAKTGLVSLSDAYIQRKLFFGSTTVPGTNPPYYITGDSVNGYIGINTQSPTYALDVNSNNKNVLALRSSNTIVQNIIAENYSKNGITSSATSNSASLGFFVGNNVEIDATPNNTISSTGKNLIIDSNALTIVAPVSISNTTYVFTLLNTNFKIIAMKFSKINPQIGFAVGTPTSQVNNLFIQYFASTTNGGASWTLHPSGIPYTNYFGTFSDTMNIFVYDSNNIYVASLNNNYFLYSIDGGETFTHVIDAITPIGKKTYNTLYASKNNSGDIVVYLGGTASEIGNQLFYISESDYTSSAIPTYNALSSIQINEMDGFGNYLYVVGAGIQKYNIIGCPTTAPATMYSNVYNSSRTYNCIYAYSATYVIAGGIGIISYTNDGTTWSDVYLPDYNIKSVYIYDSMNAVAVGDAGAFLYTINSAITWNPVPATILNASEIANQIQGPNCNLSGIFMQNLNSFVISNVISFYTTLTNKGPIVTNGASKILYVYLPALFNDKKNKVLDISGNMEITGDIAISGDIVSKKTVTASSMNINNILLTKNAYGGLDINGDVRVNGLLFTENPTGGPVHQFD